MIFNHEKKSALDWLFDIESLLYDFSDHGPRLIVLGFFDWIEELDSPKLIGMILDVRIKIDIISLLIDEFQYFFLIEDIINMGLNIINHLLWERVFIELD